MIEGLTWSTLIGAAAVDSINPCTFAVLIMLLSTILLRKGKTNVLLAGMGFISAIYLSYFLMGLGLYTTIKAAGITRIYYYIVIAVALIVGLLSIKDYFKYKPGFLAIEMPLKWRPIIKKFITHVTSAPGAIVAGLLCSLFLLPCSSGPYLVILGLMAESATRLSAIPLLLIYNIIFVLPMVIITLMVYTGFTTVEKVNMWKERSIKKLHLISGIIMLALAAMMAVALILGWI